MVRLAPFSMFSFVLFVLALGRGKTVADETNEETPGYPGTSPNVELWQTEYNTAATMASDNKLAEAIHHGKQSIAAEDNPYAHDMLAQIYVHLSKEAIAEGKATNSHEVLVKVREAVVHYQRAAQFTPDSHEYLARAGALMYEHEELRGAAEAYRTILSRWPELEDIRVAYGMTMVGMGDLSGAIHSFRGLSRLPSLAVRALDLHDDRIAQRPEAAEEEASHIDAVTHRVFIDIQAGDSAVFRVVMGLYGRAAPRTVWNHVQLARCSRGREYCYQSTRFHRLVPGFVLQGGDIENGDGSGGRNAFDRPFSDEPFCMLLRHSRAGVLESPNSGPDSNGGQFAIMLGRAAHLNGKHCVFGHVLEGLDMLDGLNTWHTDEEGRPLIDIVVVDSGELSADGRELRGRDEL